MENEFIIIISSILFAFLFNIIYTFFAFKILHINKKILNKDVLFFLLSLTLSLFVFGFLFEKFVQNYPLQRVVNTIIAGGFTYFFSKRILKLENNSSLKLAAIFILFDIFLIIIGFAISIAVQKEYNYLNNLL